MNSKKTKNITVSMGISRSNSDKVLLQIDDDVSGDSILDVEMSLESYALLLTNLWGLNRKGFCTTLGMLVKKEKLNRRICQELIALIRMKLEQQ